jgi:hypothetical protein
MRDESDAVHPFRSLKPKRFSVWKGFSKIHRREYLAMMSEMEKAPVSGSRPTQLPAGWTSGSLDVRPESNPILRKTEPSTR